MGVAVERRLWVRDSGHACIRSRPGADGYSSLLRSRLPRARTGGTGHLQALGCGSYRAIEYLLGKQVAGWSLGKLSGRLFVSAFAILVVGILKTTISAPCNDTGAWVSIAALLPAALGCVALLIVTLKERSAGNWMVWLAGVAGTGFAAMVAFWWTIMLCRAV